MPTPPAMRQRLRCCSRIPRTTPSSCSTCRRHSRRRPRQRRRSGSLRASIVRPFCGHEVFRVVKPGGKIIIVDYARPRWWHPLRYLWRPVLTALEPFALDLWREDISMWLPPSRGNRLCLHNFFGGLYQLVSFRRATAVSRRLHHQAVSVATDVSAHAMSEHSLSPRVTHPRRIESMRLTPMCRETSP